MNKNAKYLLFASFWFFLILILLFFIRGISPISSPPVAEGSVENLTMDFTRISESPSSVEFLIKVKNHDNSTPFTRSNVSIILDSLNFPVNDLRNVRMWVHERKETNVTHFTNDCTSVILVNGSTQILNCTQTVTGSHLQYDFIWEDFKEQFFKREAKVFTSGMSAVTFVNGKADEGFGLGIKEFKVRIETPLTVNGGGWGSAGIMRMNLSGKEFVDLKNSSWWNNSWGRRILFNITNPYSRAVYNITLNITINMSYVNYSLTLPNGADFRVLNGTGVGTGGGEGVEIWIEAYNVTDKHESYIYFLVSNFSSGNNTFQLYWNNSAASAISDIESAFIIGENWNASTDWTFASASCTNSQITGGRLNFTICKDQRDASYRNFSTIVNWTGNFSVKFQINVSSRDADAGCNSPAAFGLFDNINARSDAGGNGFYLLICSDTAVTPGTRLAITKEENDIVTDGALQPISLGTLYDIIITKNGTTITGNFSNVSYFSNGVTLTSTVTLSINDYNFTIFKWGKATVDAAGAEQVTGTIEDLRITRNVDGITTEFGIAESVNRAPYFNSNETFPAIPSYGNVFYIRTNLTDRDFDEVNASFTVRLPNDSYGYDVDGNVMRRRNGTWIQFVNNNSIWNSSRVNISCSPVRNCLGVWNWNITIRDNQSTPNTNFTFSTFIVNDSTIPGTVNIIHPANASSFTVPSGSSTVNLTINVSIIDNIGLSTCWYFINFTTAESNGVEIANRTFTCGNNFTTMLTVRTIRSNYYGFVYANDTMNNENFTAVSFTVTSSSNPPPSGGGGGGGGTSQTIIAERGPPILCQKQNVTWAINPSSFKLVTPPNSKPKATFELSSDTAITILLSCDDANQTEGICNRTTILPSDANLPANILTTMPVVVEARIPILPVGAMAR